VTEREIIEAELREIISLEEYETSSGLGREEYESDVMTWSCAIAAALRESRKAGPVAAAEHAVIEAAIRWNAVGERTIEQADALCAELEDAIDALSALRDEGERDDT
jgi:hypothetical protein